MLIAGLLSIVSGGCGDTRDGGTDGGDSTTPGGSGGSDAGGALGGTATGGISGIGGTAASGGATGATGPTGGSGPAASGGQGTGGAGRTGGTPGTGGQLPFGGQAGQGTGGTAPIGGTPGIGGQVPTGGQAGQGTGGGNATGGTAGTGGGTGPGAGGSDPTGGTPGTGGQVPTGGQAGQGTGGASETGGAGGTGGRAISFGTLLDPQAVMTAAQQLATSLSDPSASQWRAKGDQHRSYYFADTDHEEPYRIYVPTDWDGESELPLVMFLHGAGSDENSYLDQNGQQLLALAQEHGYLLVSPRGAQGAYGNFLRLTAPFGDEPGAAELMAQVTPESELTNQLSEQDVINVLELVLHEYPVDRTAMFLAGHSMGSGGTWYLGGKYPEYWRGLAPMSGPFVQVSGYPWESVRPLALFVTEGTQAPSLEASRLLRDWLADGGFDAEYEEVDADHGGMIPLVLPDVFDHFDRSR